MSKDEFKRKARLTGWIKCERCAADEGKSHEKVRRKARRKLKKDDAKLIQYPDSSGEKRPGSGPLERN